IFYFSVGENNLQTNPHLSITHKRLNEAVKNDLGPEWELKDFEIKDFTKKGDNYACIVTGVSCRVARKEDEKTAYYVAKLNPLRPMSTNNVICENIFAKEGSFLIQVSPTLNAILREIQYPTINFPECVYANLEYGREILLLKDLRLKGFKMFDKHRGMDFEHSKMLIKELAKLHSSSLLFKDTLINKTVNDVYPFLFNEFLEVQETGRETFEAFIKSNVDTSLKMIKHLKQYEKQYKWLENLKENVMDTFLDLIKESPENMRVICHGDCWNNNVLFRYNEDGHPIEITLLDLQMCRYGSVGLDLNYFFYTSLTGEVRNKFYDKLLSEYYHEFENVMKSASKTMPFTELEFQKEIGKKNLFGIINGILVLPLIICETEDVPDFANVKDENIEEFLKEFTDTIIKISESSPTFNTRFMSLFDDINDRGIMENDHTTISSSVK
ncbi:UNVERIFIED_CONTAM: hypothetical protein GTU68_037107, partial [Idotea baltica]|nr:hypothetical protein [Idotea baltica]